MPLEIKFTFTGTLTKAESDALTVLQHYHQDGYSMTLFGVEVIAEEHKHGHSGEYPGGVMSSITLKNKPEF